MATSFVLQGRLLTDTHLEEIRLLIRQSPQDSRRKLSKELARQWNWKDSHGQIKDMAARTLMLKLHKRGLIELPVCRSIASKRRVRPLELFADPLPLDIDESFATLTPLSITVVSRTDKVYRILSRHLERHHYLGFKGPVGENLMYRVQDRKGRDVACVLFGAAAWKVAPRDTWIGWGVEARASGIQRIANNSRFLIYPWVKVPHLASHVLGRIARRINGDWQAKYNHPLALLETFVERGRFQGTCYKAANWTCVGQTQGRSRQDRYSTMSVPIKDIYVYPLGSDFRDRLMSVTPEVSAVHA